VSERSERSFLRRARESRGEDGEPRDGEAPVEEPMTESEPRTPPGGPEPAPPLSPAGAPADDPAEPPSGVRRGGELRRSMAVVAERVDEIITTAHQMAEEIRREAEAEAERYLELRRREADLVVEDRLSGVRRALSSLRLELDDLERRVVTEAREKHDVPDPEAAAPARDRAPSSPPRPPAPAPSAYPGTGGAAASQPQPAPRDNRASALIRASQLAVQGESRERIATVLRSDFGLEHPEEILDEILPRRRW
jgi:pyruvate dehydrogenase E2 component (dihydrolipoyllysine-residue acetyltransferase)